MRSPSQYLPPTDIPLILRHLGRRPYLPIWQRMQEFTASRGPTTCDEIWLLEHDPVFTLGREGNSAHLLQAGDIPLVRVDRGGQITYHGPGQLVVYFFLDLRRRKLAVRKLVEQLEGAVGDLLAGYGIESHLMAGAPGVYVNGAKIASLGLRVSQGCSSHGLALNIDLELQPFGQINPCGHRGLAVTRLQDLAGPKSLIAVAERLSALLVAHLGYQQVTTAPA